jgi:hypothetical protein
MNSKKVLTKILQLLSIQSEVEFTDARTADGTILQSPTFDLGETVDVISEDGTKTPAPDGEHEIALKDSEGNEVVIRVETKDGKIVQRANIEEANPELPKEEEMAEADADVVEVKPIPQADQKEKVNEMPDVEGQVESGTLKLEEETETAEPIPADTDAEEKPEIEIELGKKIEDMAYIIQELQSKMAKLEEAMLPTDSEVVEEEDLPKLDGAPIEEGLKFSAEMNKKNYGKGVKDAQSNFLSKLYK